MESPLIGKLEHCSSIKSLRNVIAIFMYLLMLFLRVVVLLILAHPSLKHQPAISHHKYPDLEFKFIISNLPIANFL